MVTRSLFVCSIAIFFSMNALAFDFARYKNGSLDEILTQKRPDSDIKVLAPQKLRFEVTLTAYAESCNTGFLKQTMVMLGVPKEKVEQVPISKCIKVKSSKGKIATMYIQDSVSEFLPKEVPLGTKIAVFSDYLFLGKDGPGLLLNEFQNLR